MGEKNRGEEEERENKGYLMEGKESHKRRKNEGFNQDWRE